MAACTYYALVVHLAEGVDGKEGVSAVAWCRLLSFERKSSFCVKTWLSKTCLAHIVCRVFASKLAANFHYLTEELLL